MCSKATASRSKYPPTTSIAGASSTGTRAERGSPPADGNAPRRRVVLLGASNLTRGLPTALALAGRRSEILVAAGHGRSYGQPSRVFLRGLTGILQSGLWEALGTGPGSQTRALVTDIGNDLAYGSEPAEVAGWVEACLDRLTSAGAAIGVTLAPLASLSQLRRWQFELIKAILFPGRRLGLTQILDGVEDLNERLARLAAGHGARLIEPRTDWFGHDRIHIRRGKWPEAWATMLGACGLCDPRSAPPTPLPPWRPLTPERQTILGQERRRRQPSRLLGDGGSVSFY